MITSGYWLVLVLYVTFSALTIMVGRQQGHPDHENPVPQILF